MNRRPSYRANRGRVADPTGFLPTQISGLQLWLRADRGVTLVSGAVSQWNDYSGTGDSNKNVTQSTSTKRPTPNTADANFNNQATLTFDGTDDYLVSGTWSSALSQPATWFAAYRAGSVATGRSAFDGIASGNRHFTGNTGTDGFVNMYAGTTVLAGAVNKASTKVYTCSVFNGASSALYVNDFSSSVASGNAGSHSLTGVTIGANFLTTGPIAGEIAEIIAYSGALNAAQRAQVQDYLTRRYG